MSARINFAVSLLAGAFLAACSATPKSATASEPTALPASEAQVPPAEPSLAMCRIERPTDVLQEWVEVPEVRRGRVPSTLAKAVTPEERAADPDFDGFRLGMVDYEWTYREPTRSDGEQRPVQLDVAPTANGFVATLTPGRNGRLLDDSGPHNEYEFLPGPGSSITYTFERVDGCWVLASATEPTEGARP